MKHIYAINGSIVKKIAVIDDNETLVEQDNQPAARQMEGHKTRLAYSEDRGVYFEYIPLSAAEQREKAYQTELCVEFEGKTLTVDEANKLWQVYQAEGHYKAMELTAVIAAAKNAIREKYPD